ncbi:MAG: PEP-CTERM sorting domain-containing protein, partial [Planctomycetota bacterium]
EKRVLNPTKDSAFLERGSWSAYDWVNEKIYFIVPDGGTTTGVAFAADIFALDLTTGLTESFTDVDDSISLFFNTSFGDVTDFFSLSAGLLGDFNNSGDLDAEDIDLLFEAINAGSMDLEFDLNGDNVVDALDSEFWVEDSSIASTAFGDANLDGMVDLSDLDILGTNFLATAAGWAMADFNGDDVVDLADLDILGTNFGFGVGSLSSLGLQESVALLESRGFSAIPEPTTLAVTGLGVLALACRRRRA